MFRSQSLEVAAEEQEVYRVLCLGRVVVDDVVYLGETAMGATLDSDL